MSAAILYEKGTKFGSLTIESPAGSGRYGRLWNCICVCGAKKRVPGIWLRGGQYWRCGDHCPIAVSQPRSTKQARSLSRQQSSSEIQLSTSPTQPDVKVLADGVIQSIKSQLQPQLQAHKNYNKYHQYKIPEVGSPITRVVLQAFKDAGASGKKLVDCYLDACHTFQKVMSDTVVIDYEYSAQVATEIILRERYDLLFRRNPE